MKQTKTLAQVANDIENGNNLHEYYNQNGATIKTGNFESFGDFLSYYHQHYRPILEQVADGITPTGDNARLLRLLASDLLDIFKEDSNESEEEKEPARLLVVFRDESQYRRARDFYCLKASEATTAFYAEEYSDEIRALYFTEDPDTLDALERDLTEDLEYYGFTGYHFERD